MKKLFASKLLFILIALVITLKANAQLCQGSLGDPVVNITFGTGNNPGAPLEAGITNYAYIASTCPNDGYYSISSSTVGCFSANWHNVTEDHTPNDVNGYMMVVNASNNPGDFFVKTVDGLCGETTYEFAAWILNIEKSSSCNGNPNKPNVTFNIETTSGVVLLSSKSGDIPSANSPIWKQYGAYFKTPANITSVVIRMTNNAPGGCGNDLLLDDITFRPCGAKVVVGTNGSSTAIKNVCSSDDTPIILNGNYSGTDNVAYQWQISKDNGITWLDIAAANAIDYTWIKQPPGSYQYRLAVAPIGNLGIASCRTVSNVYIIIVNPTPIPSAKNNGPLCDGDSLILSSQNGSTYSWTGPNNYASSSQSPFITNVSSANSGKYYVRVTSYQGCINIDSTVAIVRSKPSAQFNSVSASCFGQSVQFTDASTTTVGSIVKWDWNFKDGQNSSNQITSHAFATDGNFPVRLIVTNTDGCTDSVVHNIIVNPLPVVNFLTPSICQGIQGSFFDSSFIKNGTENQFLYKWDFGDNSNSNQKNPLKTYNSGGVFSVKLTITSGDGCVNSLTKQITVSSVPVADFLISGSAFCSNKDVVITDNSSIDFGRIKSTKIYWNWTDVNDTTLDNSPSKSKQYQKSYQSFGSPATKDVVIRYVTDNGAGCSAVQTKTITLKASPQLVFDSVPTFCVDANAITITEAKETSGMQGNAGFSGAGITNTGLFSPATAGAGSHPIAYNYIALNGCDAAISRTIKVEALPRISAGPDKFYIEGSSVVLEGSSQDLNLTFKWIPATGLNNDAILNPVATPKSETLYTLQATSSNGCFAKDDMIVSVLKLPIIPNAFSPNGDGINDTWNITYLNAYPGCTVDVYNRYGQLIYTSRGYSTPWDGSVKGKPLAVGVYYYIINPKNGLKPVSGSVTILR